MTLKGQTRDPNTLRAQSRKLLELETSNLVFRFESGVPSGCTNNYPESGRVLGHVTLTIFGSTVGYRSDSLASCYLLLEFVSTITMSFFSFICIRPDCSPTAVSDDGNAEDSGTCSLPVVKHKTQTTAQEPFSLQIIIMCHLRTAILPAAQHK